jgi:hypothetical protein
MVLIAGFFMFIVGFLFSEFKSEAKPKSRKD